MEYETFQETELPHMTKKTTAVSLQSTGQIGADIQHVMKQLASGLECATRSVQKSNQQIQTLLRQERGEIKGGGGEVWVARLPQNSLPILRPQLRSRGLSD